jgi:hypothetical protein
MARSELALQIVESTRDHLADGVPAPEMWRSAMGAASLGLPAEVCHAINGIDLGSDIGVVAAWLAPLLPSRPVEANGLLVLLYEEGRAEVSESEVRSERAWADLTGVAGYPDDDGWIFVHRWDGGRLPALGLETLLGTLGIDGDGTAYRIVEYGLTFAYCAALVVGVLERSSAMALLGGRDRVGIASGFHDGDILVVAEVGPEGVSRRGRWC